MIFSRLGWKETKSVPVDKNVFLAAGFVDEFISAQDAFAYIFPSSPYVFPLSSVWQWQNSKGRSGEIREMWVIGGVRSPNILKTNFLWKCWHLPRCLGFMGEKADSGYAGKFSTKSRFLNKKNTAVNINLKCFVTHFLKCIIKLQYWARIFFLKTTHLFFFVCFIFINFLYFASSKLG